LAIVLYVKRYIRVLVLYNFVKHDYDSTLDQSIETNHE